MQINLCQWFSIRVLWSQHNCFISILAAASRSCRISSIEHNKFTMGVSRLSESCHRLWTWSRRLIHKELKSSSPSPSPSFQTKKHWSKEHPIYTFNFLKRRREYLHMVVVSNGLTCPSYMKLIHCCSFFIHCGCFKKFV